MRPFSILCSILENKFNMAQENFNIGVNLNYKSTFTALTESVSSCCILQDPHIYDRLSTIAKAVSSGGNKITPFPKLKLLGVTLN